MVIEYIPSILIGAIFGILFAVTCIWLLHISFPIWRYVESNTRINISKTLGTAVIGGIIGGIAFAVVSPMVVPPIQDAQVEAGLVDEPELDISIEYVDNASIESEYIDEPIYPSYRAYYVTVQNPTQKRMEDVRVQLNFVGEIEAIRPDKRAILYDLTSEASVYSEFRGANNSGNIGLFTIEELPPLRVVSYIYIVDTDPDEGNGVISDDPISQEEVAITSTYNWQYDGRIYSSGRFLEQRSVSPMRGSEPVTNTSTPDQP